MSPASVGVGRARRDVNNAKRRGSSAPLSLIRTAQSAVTARQSQQQQLHLGLNSCKTTPELDFSFLLTLNFLL